MCDVIGVGTLVLFLVNFQLGVIVIIYSTTIEVISWMKYVMD